MTSRIRLYLIAWITIWNKIAFITILTDPPIFIDMGHIQKPGPTGDFPKGHLNKDDEGGLRIALTNSQGKVVIDFGKPVHWIGFDIEDAEALIVGLAKQIDEIRKS